MKLYDAQVNVNSRKIFAVARELDLPIELMRLDMMAGEHKRPEFLKLNPNGKVPTLVDGSFVVWESNAIMLYLVQKHGKSKLLPTELKARAEVDQWLFWQTAHLQAAVGRIMFERVYKARMNLGQPDQTVIDRAQAEFGGYASTLDAALSKRDYICGDLTVADFALAGTFGSRETAKLDLAPLPHVAKWLQRIEARPSWVEATK